MVIVDHVDVCFCGGDLTLHLDLNYLSGLLTLIVVRIILDIRFELSLRFFITDSIGFPGLI